MTYPDTITLACGAHEDRSNGLCLLEAVAWFAGESHSDHPACVSPVLAAYGRGLNDVLGDDSRRLLIPFIPAMSRTAGDGLDEARGYLALDWIIRVNTPVWLDVAGLAREAWALRDLRCISDMAAARDARSAVLSARAAARDAARDAVWDAAGDAAGDAVWDAAGAAARDAARTAAWDAARDTAGDAARAAAGAAAWGAAGDAARAAAWDAAGDAAGDAARDAAGAAARDAARAAARDAAGAAARARLAPTVSQLQDSAIMLLSAMICLEAAA
jgi:hypothetical protein